MTGKQTHYEFQPRQRLTTDALNEQDAWTARMASEMLRRGAQGDRINVSGVVSGLQCNVVANTLNVLVSGGLACKYNAAPVLPDSNHDWIEIADSAPIVVTLDPGGISPRWDVIEIAANVVDGDADVLDVYDPSIGAAVGTLLAPLKICRPLVTVRKGTESATPHFPAGIAGVMPLAYVYVPAAAVQLNVAQVLHCRPVLFPRRGIYRGEDVLSVTASPFMESSNVRGGGVNVESDGLSDVFVANTMTGTFPNGGLPFMLVAGAECRMSAAGNYTGGGLPAGNAAVYAYAVPPPYPSGYDADVVARELYISDYSLLGAFYSAAQRNCVVVWSAAEPSLTSPNGQAGGPNATYNIVDALTFGNVTIRRSDMIYIGAASYAIAVPGLLTQRVAGNTVATERKPAKSFFADLPIGAPIQYNLRTEATGADPVRWPVTAVDVDVQVRAAVNAAGNLSIGLTDVFGDDGDLAGVWLSVYPNNAAGQQSVGGLAPMTLDSSGNITIFGATHTGAASARVIARCYRDAVLKLR